jgi:hypothetical protein
VLYDHRGRVLRREIGFRPSMVEVREKRSGDQELASAIGYKQVYVEEDEDSLNDYYKHSSFECGHRPSRRIRATITADPRVR